MLFSCVLLAQPGGTFIPEADCPCVGGFHAVFHFPHP